MRLIIAVVIALFPALANADGNLPNTQPGKPMTAAEFDAYVTNRIISFATATNPAFGVEHYRENREVIWSVGDGTCLSGKWFPQDGDICFVYEGDPQPKCWTITQTKSGLHGVYTTVPNTTVIFETKKPVPLTCGNLLF